MGGLVNLKTLRMYGCNIEFGVDATNLNLKDPETGERKLWDAIIWNFPYPVNIEKFNLIPRCQDLISKFFNCAAQNIKTDGEIRVSLVFNQYRNWEIDRHCQNAGLVVEKTEPFDRQQ